MPKKDKWVHISLWLLGFTVAYNILEAGVAIWSGQVANSIALIGFGFDSLIETSAASVLIWRMTKEERHVNPEELEKTERFVQKFVGITFFALILYILFEAGSAFWLKETTEKSTVGIILALLSLVIMPTLAWGKLRAAGHIGSRALRAEAKETIACSILSLILLVGLALNALFGWWWADPVAALLMIPWLYQEGMEGLKGEECCHCS